MITASSSEQHCSGIGGQAVLEGVMMKNGSDYAVAVRKENGEIVIKKEKYEGILSNLPVRKIPVVRGFFVLIDSLVLGLRVTDYSASMYDPEDNTDPESPKEKLITDPDPGRVTGHCGRPVHPASLYGRFLCELEDRQLKSPGPHRRRIASCDLSDLYQRHFSYEGHKKTLPIPWG